MSNGITTDRREHHEVRKVFLHACELLMPIIEGNDKGLSVSGFAMARMVREHFPDLPVSEVNTVVVTVERLHREQRLQALLKK